MKLVYRIVLHLAWVLSLLLAAWAVLFYFALTDRIDRETDDSLEARAETSIKQFLSGRALPDSGSGNDGCLLPDQLFQFMNADSQLFTIIFQFFSFYFDSPFFHGI